MTTRYEYEQYRLKKHIKKEVTITALIILAITFIFTLPLYNRFMPYKEAEPNNSIIVFNDAETMSKQEIKTNLDKLFKSGAYIYCEDVLEEASGYCNIFYRAIIIDKNLTPEKYTLALAHELTHLTHFTTSERFCNFNAWKTLYESDNAFFKNVANYYMIHDMYGFEYKEYSCWGNILEYLNEKDK